MTTGTRANPTVKIGVVGAGAIGVLLSARLAQQGLDVTLLGQRPDVLRDIAYQGIEVLGHGPVNARVKTQDLAPDACVARFDLFFLCVKSGDTIARTKLLQPMLTPQGVIISMQNGLNDGRIAAIVGPEKTAGCVLRMPARLNSPTSVTALSEQAKITIGTYADCRMSIMPNITSMLSAFTDLTITTELAAHRWAKLADNCIANPLLALTGRTMDALLADIKGRDIAHHIIGELLNVAAAENVKIEAIFGLPPQVWCDHSSASRIKCDTILAELGLQRRGQSGSMEVDLQQGKRTEIDFLNGEVCTRAARHKIKVLMNQNVVDLVHRAETGGSMAAHRVIKYLHTFTEPTEKNANNG